MDATPSRRVFGGPASWWPRPGLLAALALVGILVQGCSDNNGRVTGTESKVTGDAIGGNIKVSVTMNPGTVDRGRRGSVVVIVSSPNGFPLVGRRVDLSSLGGRLDATTGITDSNGRFTTQVYIPCETAAGTVTVTAFADNQSQVAATATVNAVTAVASDPCAGIAGTPVGGGGGGGGGGGAALPSVSITASDPSATRATGDTGTFTVARNPASATALVVFLSFGGSATPVAGACPGAPSLVQDYVQPAGSVTIPANQASGTVTITPCNNGDVAETVVATIASDPSYTGGGNAQVAINP
jgi:hypothetical protein